MEVPRHADRGGRRDGVTGHRDHPIATELSSAHRMTEVQAARTFASISVAMMDASIGCWDAKYAYWYIRPYQADPLITRCSPADP